MSQFNVSLIINGDGSVAEVAVRKVAGEVDKLGAKTKEATQKTEALGKSQRKAAGDAELLASKNRLAAGSVGNLFANLNDVGVMMASGQSPLQLALQQGTQISQVLGPLGAGGAVRALGASFLALISPVNLITIGSIAAGAAMFQWLTSSGEKAKTLEDRIEALDDATKAYAQAVDAATIPMDRMIAKYGDMAEAVRKVQLQEAELARARATRAATEALGALAGRDALSGVTNLELRGLDGMKAALRERYDQIRRLQDSLTTENARFFDFSADYAELDRLRGRIEEIQTGLAGMAGAMGVNEDSARRIALAMAEVEARSHGSAAEQIAASQALVDALVAAYGSIDAADKATDGLVSGLNAAMRAAADVAATDMAANIGAAANEAGRLFSNLAAAARVNYNRFINAGESGPDAARREVMDLNMVDITPTLASGAGGVRTFRSSSGSGGEGGAARAEAGGIAEVIARLKGEIELNRESDPVQREMLKLRKELAGATAGQRAEVENLIRTGMQEKAAMEALNYVSEQAGDALIDALMGASGAGEKLIQTLARAAAQAAILGTGPLAVLFGGKGLFGSTPAGGGWLGALIGGIFTKKAGGGWISGPGGPTDDRIPALLSNGEFVVRAAAAARNRATLEAINAGVPRFAGGGFAGGGPAFGAAGAGGGKSRMLIELGPGLVATILEEARDQSVEVVQTGLKSYDREALPARVAEISRDPRRRG